jgi:hypothetical protein
MWWCSDMAGNRTEGYKSTFLVHRKKFFLVHKAWAKPWSGYPVHELSFLSHIFATNASIPDRITFTT